MLATIRSALALYGRQEGTLGGLDALRGIAVLLVLFRHAIRPFWGEANLLPIAGLDIGVVFINGWIGVDLFFVLSGFLIAHHLLAGEARGKPFVIGKYLTRRFLRIVPLYYVVLALAVLGAFPFYDVGERLIGLRIAYHLFFLEDYLPSNIVVAFWSLAVEEKFYLVAPLLVGVAIGVKSLRTRLLLCGSAAALGLASRIAAAATAPANLTYEQFLPLFRYPFHHCIDGLALGMACAILLPALKSRWTPSQAAKVGDLLIWGGLASALAWLASGELLARITWWDETFQPTAIALTFSAAALGCALGGRTGAFLDTTVLRSVGRLSYPLYLAHMPLIPLCGVLAGVPLWAGPAGFWSFLPVFLIVTFVVSFALHQLVEKPFLKLKDRAPNRYVAAPPPA